MLATFDSRGSHTKLSSDPCCITGAAVLSLALRSWQSQIRKRTFSACHSAGESLGAGELSIVFGVFVRHALTTQPTWRVTEITVLFVCIVLFPVRRSLTTLSYHVLALQKKVKRSCSNSHQLHIKRTPTKQQGSYDLRCTKRPAQKVYFVPTAIIGGLL